MSDRIIYDYYYNEQFFFRIGHVKHLEAGYPMSLHEHGQMMEFVYQERGYQNYQVNGQDYVLHQGDVFFTLPGELHDTGSFPREISMFYYLIIDPTLISKLNIFSKQEEYIQFENYFYHAERLFKASYTLSGALNHLFKCFNTKDRHFDTHIRNAISEVLIAIAAPYTSPKKTSAISIERSLHYIEEHLEENIHVADLAAFVNTSLSTYNKYFTQHVGMAPAEYILSKKIEKTRELLSSTDLSITEIACRYGFSSSQYFATVFKRFSLVTPTQYRHSARKLPDRKENVEGCS